MESRKEHFIIKIKTKEGVIVYWRTATSKVYANMTVNRSIAKKYYDFNEATEKAAQISEKNNVTTWVVKVETIVRTDEVGCFVPKKLSNKKDA